MENYSSYKYSKLSNKVLDEMFNLVKKSNYGYVLPHNLLDVITKFLPLSSNEKIKIQNETAIFLNIQEKGRKRFLVSEEIKNIFKIAEEISDDYEATMVNIDHLIMALCEVSFSHKTFNENKTLIKNNLTKENLDNEDSKDNVDIEDEISPFAYNMVDIAKKDKYSYAIGRTNEIIRIIEILLKKKKCNPLLLGNPGVGKTEIIKSIALMIANNEIKPLKGYKIYNVDINSIVAGTRYRGQFEEKMKNFIDKISKNHKIILFF